MTETLIAVQTVQNESGRTFSFSYYRIETGREYGVCIRDQDGAAAMARDVTREKRRINALLRKLVRGNVSPTGLPDVLEDWLAG